MVRTQIGIITGFFLLLLCISSCGFREDTEVDFSQDDYMTVDSSSIDGTATPEGAEYYSAAHILITWDTFTEDSLPVDEGDALNLITDIQERILSGQASFEEMAFEYSRCTSAPDSGRLPSFTKGGISEELDSIITSLEPGEVSGVVRTRFGYHLVKRLSS